MDEDTESDNTPPQLDLMCYSFNDIASNSSTIVAKRSATPVDDRLSSLDDASYVSHDSPRASSVIKKEWLRHVPINIFSIPLGLGGLTNLLFSWQQHVSSIDNNISLVAYYISIAAYLTCSGIYSAKFVLHKDVVRTEYSTNSRSMVFFAPVLGALVLLQSTADHYIVINNKPPWWYIVIWSTLLIIQFTASCIVYRDFLNSKVRGLSVAHPTYMMSYMGWLLLSSTSTYYNGKVVCLSIGLLLLLIVDSAVVRNLNNLSFNDPTTFLILAPIAQAGIALFKIQESVLSLILLYADTFILVLFLLWGGLAAITSSQKHFLAFHWTFTFPISGIANGLVLMISTNDDFNTVLAASVTIVTFVIVTQAILQLVLCTVITRDFIDPILKNNSAADIIIP